MKQYLWVGVALLFVSLNASDNPFDLKENFGKLENAQDMLLLELRKVAEAKELAEDQELEAAPAELDEKESTKSLPIKSDNASVENTSTMLKSELKLETMRQDALDSVKENFDAEKEKQVLLEKVKQKEVEIQKVKAEAERREVESYEKQRADKLAQQAKDEAAALEREALVQKEAKEKKLAEEKVMKKQLLEAAKAVEVVKPIPVEKTKQKNVKKMISKVVTKEEVTPSIEKSITSIDDINVTREKMEAKLAADKAYEDAVKEMSQED